MFSKVPNPNVNFWITIILLSANALNVDQYEIGKELHVTKQADGTDQRSDCTLI